MYKRFVSFYNPEILEYSKEKIELWEACISNNDEIAMVERPKAVMLRFTNYQGNVNDLQCDGLMARIVQHELDHLNGELMEEKCTRTVSIKEIESPDMFEKFSLEN